MSVVRDPLYELSLENKLVSGSFYEYFSGFELFLSEKLKC